MTPLQTIREAVVKAVPEIMELNIGQFFKWNNDIWKVNCHKCDKEAIYAFSCSGDAHDFGFPNDSSDWEYKYKKFFGDELKEIEILGRPIQLHDVLFAVKYHLKDIKDASAYGPFIDSFLGGGSSVRWNLVLPLDQQSPKTLQFLAEILK